MAPDDEHGRVRRQLGGHLGESPRDDPGAGRQWPATALADDDAVRTPRWLDEEPGPDDWRDRLIPARFRGTRLDAGRRGVATMAGIGLLTALVTVVVLLWDRPVAQSVPPLPAIQPAAVPVDSPVPPDTPLPAGEPVPARAQPAELVVSVVGLVNRAGLVRLPSGARVADALSAAGGVLDGADLAGLNLAQRLADGDQVRVGPTGSGAPPPGSATISGGAGGTAPAGAAGDSATATGTPVDLNAATEADLDALPGVGPVTAKAIIAWREINGRFTEVEQLAEVDGIGPGRLARLRELVTV
ncbi:ComEA family DNA-binding protein [Nocardia jinanensis]|uniref:Membrane protein n=1 Tax=Nocardia jinanensis TaxID=382504 RepID=A0A917RV40_9NOCA|nr:ComEA family DNA-binding protein [Nocardia jinanensis]GGL35029.1 membrane protein [Nocardia jinanensis]